VDVLTEPEVDALGGGGIGGGERGVFETGEEAEFSAAPIEAERTGDDHEIAGGGAAEDDFEAKVGGTGTVGVGGGVVDAVDGAGLGGGGGGGEGEVGVAAGMFEETELVVEAAPTAIGTGVGEGPVAMDEGETDGGVGACSAEISGGGEDGLGTVEGGEEVFGGVVVVMEMDFKVYEAGVGEGTEGVEMLGMELVDGIEHGVDGREAVGVTEVFENEGETVEVSLDASGLGGFVGEPDAGFEVIDEAEHYVDGRGGTETTTAGGGAKVVGGPEVEGTGDDDAPEEDAKCEDQDYEDGEKPHGQDSSLWARFQMTLWEPRSQPKKAAMTARLSMTKVRGRPRRLGDFPERSRRKPRRAPV